MYNSPYAFSDNKVISHVELAGLEAYPLHPNYGLYNITETFRRAFVDVGRGVDKLYVSVSTTFSQVISNTSVNMGVYSGEIQSSIDVKSTTTLSSNFADFLTPVQFSNGDIGQRNSNLYNLKTESSVEQVNTTKNNLKIGGLDVDFASFYSVDLGNGGMHSGKEIKIGKSNFSKFWKEETSGSKTSTSEGIKVSFEISFPSFGFGAELESGKKHEK
ncbi:hypothetical protein [Algoriphagus sp. NG3]|uniref:hypothetical protein n=1 Tax=Algoriphagus sp. NG3 TaxID=3097546 RepID=UPI002A804769|nr:hypothetical protein [Algoriphagus sp. NG3]WPR73730.1 hypothetical protein SLW71_13685 [Algoriphagus sp. NG3]